MAEGAIFLNSGPLFSGERLESLEDTPEWEADEEVRDAYDKIRETFEKHATRLAGNPPTDETRFYMINPTLHALGFTHSVHEPVEVAGERQARVDYVLFPNSADFYEARQTRGSASFFRYSIGIAKAVEWGYDMSLEEAVPSEEEGVEVEEQPDIDPALELDLLLRTTGKDYGILTNGCDWRLYHRATSSLQKTFFQADMIGAIKSDFEDFKRFYLLFRRAAFLIEDTGTCYLDRMLQ